MSLDPTNPTAEHLAAMLTEAGIAATPAMFAMEYGIVTWALDVAASADTIEDAQTAAAHARSIFDTITGQLEVLFAAQLADGGTL